MRKQHRVNKCYFRHSRILAIARTNAALAEGLDWDKQQFAASFISQALSQGCVLRVS